MNKSSQYNQQEIEPKQCKSEVEELRIHQKWKLAIGLFQKNPNRGVEVILFWKAPWKI